MDRNLLNSTKIAKLDKPAVGDCVNIYGSLVWALAKKFTKSTEEAEEATIESEKSISLFL